ncbi:MAG: CPBP family glutamic-type intramembrane protease [Thermoplasmatota archaeon]
MDSLYLSFLMVVTAFCVWRIAIALFVYHDASRLGVDAVSWLGLASAAGMIGLIAWLVVRPRPIPCYDYPGYVPYPYVQYPPDAQPPYAQYPSVPQPPSMQYPPVIRPPSAQYFPVIQPAGPQAPEVEAAPSPPPPSGPGAAPPPAPPAPAAPTAYAAHPVHPGPAGPPPPPASAAPAVLPAPSAGTHQPPPTPPVCTRVRPWNPFSRHRVLATFVAAIALSNLVLTPPMLTVIQDASLDDPGKVMQALFTPQMLLLAALVQDVTLVGLTYIAVFRPRHLTLPEIGLAAGKLGALPIAVGALSGLGMVAMSEGIGCAMERLAGVPLEAAFFVVPRDAAGLALVLTAVAAVAPPAEELFFRGFALPAIERRAGVMQGVVLSSLLFAAAHLSITGFPPLFLVGVWLAALFRKYGIAPCIAAHAVNNIVAVALIYFGI